MTYQDANEYCNDLGFSLFNPHSDEDVGAMFELGFLLIIVSYAKYLISGTNIHSYDVWLGPKRSQTLPKVSFAQFLFVILCLLKSPYINSDDGLEAGSWNDDPWIK